MPLRFIAVVVFGVVALDSASAFDVVRHNQPPQQQQVLRLGSISNKRDAAGLTTRQHPLHSSSSPDDFDFINGSNDRHASDFASPNMEVMGSSAAINGNSVNGADSTPSSAATTALQRALANGAVRTQEQDELDASTSSRKRTTDSSTTSSSSSTLPQRLQVQWEKQLRKNQAEAARLLARQPVSSNLLQTEQKSTVSSAFERAIANGDNVYEMNTETTATATALLDERPLSMKAEQPPGRYSTAIPASPINGRMNDAMAYGERQSSSSSSSSSFDYSAVPLITADANDVNRREYSPSYYNTNFGAALVAAETSSSRFDGTNSGTARTTSRYANTGNGGGGFDTGIAPVTSNTDASNVRFGSDADFNLDSSNGYMATTRTSWDSMTTNAEKENRFAKSLTFVSVTPRTVRRATPHDSVRNRQATRPMDAYPPPREALSPNVVATTTATTTTTWPEMGGAATREASGYVTDSYTQPGEAYAQQAEAYTQPTEDYTQQTEHYTQSTEDYTQSTEADTQPTEEYTQSTEAYTQPTEEYVQPRAYPPPRETARATVATTTWPIGGARKARDYSTGSYVPPTEAYSQTQAQPRTIAVPPMETYPPPTPRTATTYATYYSTMPMTTMSAAASFMPEEEKSEFVSTQIDALANEVGALSNQVDSITNGPTVTSSSSTPLAADTAAGSSNGVEPVSSSSSQQPLADEKDYSALLSEWNEQAVVEQESPAMSIDMGLTSEVAPVPASFESPMPDLTEALSTESESSLPATMDVTPPLSNVMPETNGVVEDSSIPMPVEGRVQLEQPEALVEEQVLAATMPTSQESVMSSDVEISSPWDFETTDATALDESSATYMTVNEGLSEGIELNNEESLPELADEIGDAVRMSESIPEGIELGWEETTPVRDQIENKAMPEGIELNTEASTPALVDAISDEAYMSDAVPEGIELGWEEPTPAVDPIEDTVSMSESVLEGVDINYEESSPASMSIGEETYTDETAPEVELRVEESSTTIASVPDESVTTISSLSNAETSPEMSELAEPSTTMDEPLAAVEVASVVSASPVVDEAWTDDLAKLDGIGEDVPQRTDLNTVAAEEAISYADETPAPINDDLLASVDLSKSVSDEVPAPELDGGFPDKELREATMATSTAAADVTAGEPKVVETVPAADSKVDLSEAFRAAQASLLEKQQQQYTPVAGVEVVASASEPTVTAEVVKTMEQRAEDSDSALISFDVKQGVSEDVLKGAALAGLALSTLSGNGLPASLLVAAPLTTYLAVCRGMTGEIIRTVGSATWNFTMLCAENVLQTDFNSALSQDDFNATDLFESTVAVLQGLQVSTRSAVLSSSVWLKEQKTNTQEYLDREFVARIDLEAERMRKPAERKAEREAMQRLNELDTLFFADPMEAPARPDQGLDEGAPLQLKVQRWWERSPLSDAWRSMKDSLDVASASTSEWLSEQNADARERRDADFVAKIDLEAERMRRPEERRAEQLLAGDQGSSFFMNDATVEEPRQQEDILVESDRFPNVGMTTLPSATDELSPTRASPGVAEKFETFDGSV